MIIGMAFAQDRERILADTQFPQVERKLLSIGGREMVYAPSTPMLLDLVIERGQTFDGSNVRELKGSPNRCHDNVVARWEKQKDRYRIVTGFGLSDDGLWRQHSWLLLADDTVVETTVERITYHGVILEGELANWFAAW